VGVAQGPKLLAPFSNRGIEGIVLFPSWEDPLKPASRTVGAVGVFVVRPLGAFRRRSLLLHPRSWAKPPGFIFVFLTFIFPLPRLLPQVWDPH
jgi:hypothetical protein